MRIPEGENPFEPLTEEDWAAMRIPEGEDPWQSSDLIAATLPPAQPDRRLAHWLITLRATEAEAKALAELVPPGLRFRVNVALVALGDALRPFREIGD